MLEQVQKLYEDYFAEFDRLEKNRRPGAGAFGFAGGPRDYPCHQRFGEALERLLRAAEAQNPGPEQTARLLEYIYFAPQNRENRRDAVYWMLTAVHGMTEALIPLLPPEDAGRLLSRYEQAYPRRTRLPAQKKTASALKRRARG